MKKQLPQLSILMINDHFAVMHKTEISEYCHFAN